MCNVSGSHCYYKIEVDDIFVKGKHAIFGRISKGMKIVSMIGMVETTGQDRPTQDLVIYSAYAIDENGVRSDHY